MPSIVRGHFRDRKKYIGIKRKRIKEINQQIIGLEGLAIYIGLGFLGKESLGIKGLKVFLNRYIYYQEVSNKEDKVRVYKYISRSKYIIKEYRKKVYSQVNNIKKERIKKDIIKERFQRESIKFQRFFKLSSQNIEFKVRREVVIKKKDKEKKKEKKEKKDKVKERQSRRLERLILKKKDKNQKRLKEG